MTVKRNVGKTAKEVLKENDMYIKCLRCPYLDQYARDLSKVEGGLPNNNKMYVSKVSYALEYCCSKKKGVLDAKDIVKGKLGYVIRNINILSN